MTSPSMIGQQKIPLDEALMGTGRGIVDQYHQLIGKAMPASVTKVEKNQTIVRVKIEIQSDFTFPEITCAVVGQQYIRFPIQEGAKGLIVPSDYYLGAMTGMGSGVATLGREPNLTTMVWMPLGNKKLDDVPDEDSKKTVLYGEEGVVIQTQSGEDGTPDAKLDITDEGFKFYIKGQLKYIIDGNGMRMIGGPRTAGGNFGITVTDHGTQIDNFNWLNHVHQGVQPGAGNSQKINETVSPP